jgi:hypothetical protein
MKKITTEFLRTNPTGTACGSVGNTALSTDEVIEFIDNFFGGEIFINDNDDDDDCDDDDGVYEIHAKIHKHITKKELSVLFYDENLKEAVEEYEEDFEKLSKNDLVGFIFEYLISEIGDGSARYEFDCLDENEMLFFEVE